MGTHRFDGTEKDGKAKLSATKVVVELSARDAGSVGVLFPDFGNRQTLNLFDPGASDNGTNWAGRIDIHLGPEVDGLGKASPQLYGLLAV